MNASSASTATRQNSASLSGQDLASEVNVCIELVTPKQAEMWLGRNRVNRKLRSNVVDRLAGAITRGEWQLNGDSVRFSTDGDLLDGQHRLTAVVRAGQPVQMLVIRNLPEQSRITMDNGAKRMFADYLSFRQEVDTSTLAAALRLYWRYINGKIRANFEAPTYEELVGVLEEVPDMRRSAKVARHALQALGGSRSIAAVAHQIFTQIDEIDCDGFFAQLGSGVGLHEGSSILLLRNWLTNPANAGRQRQPAYVLALYIKAWNSYREDPENRLGALRWRTGGESPESFPIPV